VTVAVLVFVLSLVAGLPIYLAMLGAGVWVLLFVLHLPPQMVVTGVYDSLYKTALAAVPFFLLAGVLVEKSSMSRRLSNLMIALVGRLPGGVPIAGLLANEFFGAMSGSAPAATAAIGKMMYPVIERQYGDRLALGLLTSAGALAIVMPPSITMILYGAAGGVSVGKLFLAGIVPALIIGVIIAGYLVLVGRKAQGRLAAAERVGLRRAVKEGALVILLPVVVLGGIYAGIMTPTEAGAVSAVYVLAVAGLVYRDLSLKKLGEALMETVRLIGQIFILIAASGVFAQALTMVQVPQMISRSLGGGGSLVFLLVVNLVFLVLGMLVDPSSAVLVMTPLLLPTAQALGIDLVHLGIVMVVNLAIGMFTPPFGLNLFVAQSVFKRRMEEVVRACLPFFLCYLIALAVITYLPGLYMWLPNMLTGH